MWADMDHKNRSNDSKDYKVLARVHNRESYYGLLVLVQRVSNLHFYTKYLKVNISLY